MEKRKERQKKAQGKLWTKSKKQHQRDSVTSHSTASTALSHSTASTPAFSDSTALTRLSSSQSLGYFNEVQAHCFCGSATGTDDNLVDKDFFIVAQCLSP
jgi:hypothetical protein